MSELDLVVQPKEKHPIQSIQSRISRGYTDIKNMVCLMMI